MYISSRLVSPESLFAFMLRFEGAEFLIADDRTSNPIDLNPDIKEHRISRFEISVSELSIFKKLFDPGCLEKRDDGETESLAFLLDSAEKCRLGMSSGELSIPGMFLQSF
jgi:hypothetical protein